MDKFMNKKKKNTQICQKAYNQKYNKEKLFSFLMKFISYKIHMSKKSQILIHNSQNQLLKQYKSSNRQAGCSKNNKKKKSILIKIENKHQIQLIFRKRIKQQSIPHKAKKIQ